MSSFTAELHVNGHTYPVVHFHLAFTQSTGPRGQVTARVRHGHLELELDVPHDDHLLGWAATWHKALAGTLVTLNDVGQPQEHIAFATGHCVYYHEVFEAGNQRQGSYRCQVHISDPAGFTLGPGAGAAPYAAPAAREHGQPVAAVTTAPRPVVLSDCSEGERLRLQSLVDSNCKKSKLKCISTDFCPKIESEMQAINDCIAARTKINMKCFKGGDPGHNQQITDKIQSLLYCQELYARKCGNAQQPLPFPVPATLPKVDPKVPVVLTGTALLLYYLMEALEAALIIL